MNKQRIILIACAAAGIISCFFSWFSSEFGANLPNLESANDLFNGINAFGLGYGYVILLAYAAVAVIPFIGKDKTQKLSIMHSWMAIVAGGIGLLLTLFSMMKMGNVGMALFKIQFDMGVYISLIAGIGIVASSYLLSRKKEK